MSRTPVMDWGLPTRLIVGRYMTASHSRFDTKVRVVSPLRVLLVEDDLDVAAGIGDYLALHEVEVDFAGDAAEALHVLGSTRFDVLILDVQLPGEDGLSLCRRLKEDMGLQTPVLFLTAQDSLDAKLRGFAAGALDYVVKPFEPAELWARVQALAARVAVPSATGLVVGPYRLEAERHVLWRGELHLGLSELTTRLLQALMQAYPGTVSRDALCEALWQGVAPDSDPLRTHVHQLRRSLLARFGTPLIATLRGVGYRFSIDDDASAQS